MFNCNYFHKYFTSLRPLKVGKYGFLRTHYYSFNLVTTDMEAAHSFKFLFKIILYNFLNNWNLIIESLRSV